MGEKKEVLSTALGHLRTKRVIAGRKGSFQDEKGSSQDEHSSLDEVELGKMQLNNSGK